MIQLLLVMNFRYMEYKQQNFDERAKKSPQSFVDKEKERQKEKQKEKQR